VDGGDVGRGSRHVALNLCIEIRRSAWETPLECLTNWRMYKATGLLQENDRKLFGVAKSVGYDSDAAFSKAFKRVVGCGAKEY
jgi:AraC-like DNA-binding protein